MLSLNDRENILKNIIVELPYIYGLILSPGYLKIYEEISNIRKDIYNVAIIFVDDNLENDEFKFTINKPLTDNLCFWSPILKINEEANKFVKLTLETGYFKKLLDMKAFW